MARLATHDKKTDDEKIAEFLSVLETYPDDERNFIKKTVNWSLRQIGKRDLSLNKLAVEAAEKIKPQNKKSAR
jgi:3-methyladenine DNA glycosylase AlkD